MGKISSRSGKFAKRAKKKKNTSITCSLTGKHAGIYTLRRHCLLQVLDVRVFSVSEDQCFHAVSLNVSRYRRSH